LGSQADLPGLPGGWTVPSWALETREPYGVWGGMSVEERQAMQSGQRLA
jgi:transcription factor WhiB